MFQNVMVCLWEVQWGKYSFLFQTAFNEMLADFAKHQPSLVFDGKKIPYDWTVYYLRKKALTEMISKVYGKGSYPS